MYELTIIGEGFDSNEDTNVATASDGYLSVTFDDRSGGWTSFRGYKQEGGLSLNNTYYTFNGGKMWEHHSTNVTRNNFYNSGTQQSYVIPIFNDAPSLVKQFNSLSYEGDTGWELEYIETDIGSSGTLPVLATSFTTTLQLSGAATNSVFNGANTVQAKQGQSVQWAIFVEPLNSQFKFTNVNNVTLTQASGSTLTVTNPQAITNENQLVFLIQHTVGTSNSIQTLNIGGTGASLAFTVALLTINMVDTIANAALTPASRVFNTAGNNNVVFTTSAFTNYYVDNSNITVDISGVPASVSPGSLTPSNGERVGDNIKYTLPVTVTNTATAGVITVNGNATLKYTLNWAQGNVVSPGTIAVPSGEQVGTAYYNSPFDANTTRFATITYTCTNTQVLTSSSYTDSAAGYPAGTVVNNNLNDLASDGFSAGILVINIQIPVLTGDTTATPTITTVAPATATLGNTTTPQTLNVTGDAVVIPGSWNVHGTASPDTGFDWILLNGANSTSVLTPGTSFTLSATTNTGSARTGTFTIRNTNTRVTLAEQIITINQA